MPLTWIGGFHASIGHIQCNQEQHSTGSPGQREKKRNKQHSQTSCAGLGLDVTKLCDCVDSYPNNLERIIRSQPWLFKKCRTWPKPVDNTGEMLSFSLWASVIAGRVNNPNSHNSLFWANSKCVNSLKMFWPKLIVALRLSWGSRGSPGSEAAAELQNWNVIQHFRIYIHIWEFTVKRQVEHFCHGRGRNCTDLLERWTTEIRIQKRDILRWT